MKHDYYVVISEQVYFFGHERGNMLSRDCMPFFGRNTLPMTHLNKDDIAECFAFKTLFDGKI